MSKEKKKKKKNNNKMRMIVSLKNKFQPAAKAANFQVEIACPRKILIILRNQMNKLKQQVLVV